MAHPSPVVALRPATPADCALLADLIMELATYEKAPEQCFATAEGLHTMLFGPTPRAEALMAELDGVVVGYAIWFHNFSTWECAPGLYLEDVYVQPQHRGLGIGKRILAHLAALAVERGCKRFEWAVLDWNEPSRVFYRALGATERTEWVLCRMEGEALAKLAKIGQADQARTAKPGPARATPAKVAAAAERASARALPAPPKPASSRKSTKPVAADLFDEAPAEPAPKAKAGGVVTIYTDGGCEPNPGDGAWAAVVVDGGKQRELSGAERNTTNNRMEMTAVVRALEALGDKRRHVKLIVDSEYVMKGMTSWLASWKRKGWRTTTGPVKNKDLWVELDALCQLHDIDWSWTKGHAGDVLNERCDQLCRDAMREQRRGSRR